MKKKKKEKKLDYFIIIMTGAMLLLLIGWIIKDFKPKNDTKETPIIEKYDVDDFTKIDLKKALELIKENKLSFIYIGYEGCNACDKFVPHLAKISQSYDMTVYYINIKEIDTNSKDWKKFTDKITKKITLNTQIDEERKSETKTIGKFLYENNYTPTFVVMKANKCIDGSVGGMINQNLINFLDKVGFKKSS